jgi:hypothetical protein
VQNVTSLEMHIDENKKIFDDMDRHGNKEEVGQWDTCN